MTSGWTDERTEFAQNLWRDGHTASDIAERLQAKGFHGVTRNSVISKMHRTKTRQSRLGNLPQIKSVEQKIRKKAKAKVFRQTPPIVNEPPKPQITFSDDTKPLLVKIDDLTDDMCRWPIGDPYDSSFAYCGCQKENNRPYCSRHAAIAYVGFKKAKAA